MRLVSIPPLTGLILAGGKSSRFGRDKASALLHGRPLLQWAVSALEPVATAVVIVKAVGQQLPPIETVIPLTVIDDQYEGMGPLAGLVTGFTAVETDLCFATSCDAPLLEPGLVRMLVSRAEQADVVAPFVEGFMQPLVAIYRPSGCAPVFEACLREGKLRIVPAYPDLRTVVVREDEVREADPGLRSFRNANRPERLAEIEALLVDGG